MELGPGRMPHFDLDPYSVFPSFLYFQKKKLLRIFSYMMMMSHAEPVIGLVFHPYCRHPSDGGAHQTDGLGQNQLRDL